MEISVRHSLIAACLAFAVGGAAQAGTATTTGPGPTPVTDYSNPVRVPYQEWAIAPECTVAGTCTVTLPANTGTRVLVTHVSCEFFIATGGIAIAATLSGPADNSRQILPVFSYSAIGEGTPFGINSDVYFFIPTGTTPQVVVNSATEPVASFDCTLTGYRMLG